MGMKYQVRHIYEKPEAVEGLYSVPDGTSDAVRALDPEIEPDYEEIQEQEVTSSMEETGVQIGQKRWRITYGIHVKGGGASGGVPLRPKWERQFLSAGMRWEALFKVTPTATLGGTATIKHGETFTQAGSAATGMIVGSYANLPGPVKPSRIHYRPHSGTLDATNVVTCSGGCTFTPTATPVGHGFVYMWTHKVWVSLNRGAITGTILNDHILVKKDGAGKTIGAYRVLDISSGTPPVQMFVEVLFGTLAQGDLLENVNVSGSTTIQNPAGIAVAHNFSTSNRFFWDGNEYITTGNRSGIALPFKTGQPARASVTKQGFQALITSSSIPTNVVLDTLPSLRFVAAEFRVGEAGRPFTGEKAFFIDQFNLDFGGPLTIRSDANAQEGGVSYRINSRAARLTIDPEMVPELAWPIFQMWAGQTPFSSKIRMGCPEDAISETTATGAIVWFDLPYINFRSVSKQNRDGDIAAQIVGAVKGSGSGDVLGRSVSDAIYIFVL